MILAQESNPTMSVGLAQVAKRHGLEVILPHQQRQETYQELVLGFAHRVISLIFVSTNNQKLSFLLFSLYHQFLVSKQSPCSITKPPSRQHFAA